MIMLMVVKIGKGEEMFKVMLCMPIICLSCSLVAMQEPQKKDASGSSNTIGDELKKEQANRDEIAQKLLDNDAQQRSTASHGPSTLPNIPTAPLAFAAGIALGSSIANQGHGGQVDISGSNVDLGSLDCGDCGGGDCCNLL